MCGDMVTVNKLVQNTATQINQTTLSCWNKWGRTETITKKKKWKNEAVAARSMWFAGIGSAASANDFVFFRSIAFAYHTSYYRLRPLAQINGCATYRWMFALNSSMADWGRLFAVPAKAAAAAAAAPAPAAASFPQPYCVTVAATEAADVLLAAAALAAAAVWQARFVSSWVMRSSIRYCATLIAFGWPVMVTIRLRVPGAKMPFFDIWMFAPDMCWISTKLRPAGPVSWQEREGRGKKR